MNRGKIILQSNYTLQSKKNSSNINKSGIVFENETQKINYTRTARVYIVVCVHLTDNGHAAGKRFYLHSRLEEKQL